MIRWFWVVLAVWLVPAAAFGQQAGGAEPYRKWESGAGLQLSFWPNEDPVVRTPAYIINVARFWSEHFATEAALTVNADTRTETVFFSSGPQGYQFEYKEARPAGLQLAVTYQFFENVFAHPYVSAGAQIGWFSTVRDTSRPAQFGPPLSEHIGDSVEGRPFVAAGFKSYFDNGRAFMRSEFAIFADTQGTLRGVVRIGAGVEF